MTAYEIQGLTELAGRFRSLCELWCTLSVLTLGIGNAERPGIPPSHLSAPLKSADFLPRNTASDVKFSAVCSTVLKPHSVFSFLALVLCTLEV